MNHVLAATTGQTGPQGLAQSAFDRGSRRAVAHHFCFVDRCSIRDCRRGTHGIVICFLLKAVWTTEARIDVIRNGNIARGRPLPELTLAELSELIGAIHDCALDPGRWQETLGRICSALDCVAGQLYLVSRETDRPRFAASFNEPPEATRLLLERFGPEAAEFNRLSVQGWSGQADEPVVLSRSPHAQTLFESRFYQEWARPLGYCDGISVLVIQEDHTFGMLAAARHERIGLVSEREISLMTLLAPHMRRAVAIGDLLDMRELHVKTLGEALDDVTSGIALVTADGIILHANAAARSMLENAGPIRSLRGRLTARDPAASNALSAAIAAAAATELGREGIGLALNSLKETRAVAHVLPLAATGARGRPLPRAAAAVFINDASAMPHPLPDGVAESLGLTNAETRLLRRIMEGGTLVAAATALGIGNATAKTHLARIFAKAGVSRQAELVSLIARLTAPVRRQ